VFRFCRTILVGYFPCPPLKKRNENTSLWLPFGGGDREVSFGGFDLGFISLCVNRNLLSKPGIARVATRRSPTRYVNWATPRGSVSSGPQNVAASAFPGKADQGRSTALMNKGNFLRWQSLQIIKLSGKTLRRKSVYFDFLWKRNLIKAIINDIKGNNLIKFTSKSAVIFFKDNLFSTGSITETFEMAGKRPLVGTVWLGSVRLGSVRLGSVRFS